jgi:hypothetical protein
MSGTPIGSGILIQFPIPEIRVRFFFRIPLLKIIKSEFRFQNLEFRFFYVGTQYISFHTRKQPQHLFLPKLHLLVLYEKRVDVMLAGLKMSRCDAGGQNNHATKLTSTQNK